MGVYIDTEATVAAGRARVWQIIADVSRYPEWNPYIVELHGSLAPGAAIDFRFAVFAGLTLPASARVLAANPEAELRWAGHLVAEWLFRAEHFHLIEPLAEGTVRFRHGEIFSGLLASVLSPLIRLWAPGRYRAVNLALRHRAEGT